MTSPPERPGDASGFTLIELIVVLAIGALMLGLILPRLGPPLRRAALDEAGTEIRAALHTAHATAIAEDQTTVLRGDLAGNGYWLAGRYRRLAAADPHRPIVVTGEVAFFPWGGASGGRIRIEDSAGRRDIAVDAATGREHRHR